MGKNVGGESYGDILTMKRDHDWIAYLRNSPGPGTWEAGKTEAEALGKLLISLHAAGYRTSLQKQEAQQ